MKILLVDDSKSARYALRLQLQRHGVEVDTAESAESAFEHLKGALPDAIMMDHMMPGLNGFEALEVIRKDPRTAHLPVVMCTSHEDPDFATTAKGKGVVGILPKSTAPEKLPAILALLREAVSGEAPPPAAAVPAAASSPEGISEARALDLVDARLESQLDSRIDDRLTTRVGALIAPLLDELRRELTERLSAETVHLIDDRIAGLEQTQETERPAVDAGDIRAAAEQFAAERLPAMVGAEIESAATRLSQSTLPDLVKTETEAAIDRVLKQTLPQLVKTEIDGATESVARQTLPELVKVEIEAERGQVMDLVDQYLGEFRSQGSQGPVVGEETLAEIEGKITQKIQEAYRRETREGIESAVERATRAAEEIAVKARPASGALYAAVAGAAGIGIAAAVVVYLLLS